MIRQQWPDELLIVTVSVDRTPEPAKRFLEGMGALEAGVHLWAGEGGAAAIAFGIQSIPTVLVVDPEGRVVWRGTPDELDLSELWARAQERASSTP